MRASKAAAAWGLFVAIAGGGAAAHALPVELKDANGTRYGINTQVVPFQDLSNASGALTDATFVKSVTVTSYYVGFTPWFGFLTTYTVQRQVNVPLQPSFDGFNGLAVTAVNGVKLSQPLIFNPGAPLAAEGCPANGKNRELSFATQAFAAEELALTRKVHVPHNKEWVRWQNIVSNTGTSTKQVTITLLGVLASGTDTKVVDTSTGNTSLTTAESWFTTAQSVPSGIPSTQPRIGFVLQGPGATAPLSNLGISTTSSPPGKTAFSYTTSIPPGQAATILTFVTVQGKSKAAKSTCQDIVKTPLPSAAIQCMSERELAQVVNFAPIVPPVLKNATVKLKFNTTGQDTVQWKGKITIGAGISLAGLPVLVDFGGVTQTFVLKKGGSANNGNGNKFTLDATLKNGVTKAGTYNFSFNLKGDLQTALADYGLTNANAADVAVSIPLSLNAGGPGYAVDQPFTYNATAGKSGTAKAG